MAFEAQPWSLVDIISEALNNEDYVVGVFLDFSKEFDIVNLKNMGHGIQCTAMDWFSDHLSNRSLYVAYNGATSKRETIKCDVPQESIIVWSLVIPVIYKLPVNSVEVSNDYFSVLFADDTNMFLTGGKYNSNKCHSGPILYV